MRVTDAESEILLRGSAELGLEILEKKI